MNQLKALVAPISVNYEVTPSCDLFCEFCFVESEQGLQHPPLKVPLRILDKLAEAEVFEVRLFGGEFFTYPHWREVMEYAFAKNFFLSFVSNGTHITPEVIEVMKACDINAGSISLHGPAEVHDKITGLKGSFETAVRGITLCLQAGIQISILTTLTKVNRGTLDQLLDDLEKRGVRGFSYGVSRLAPYGRAREDWEENKLSFKDYLNLFEFLHQLNEKRQIPAVLGDAFPICLIPEKYHYLIQGCWVGTGFGHISWDGEVRGCTVAFGSYGNIFTTPLKEIWQGKRLTEFRQLGWMAQCCKVCKTFCGGGCHASCFSEEMHVPDEFLETRPCN